MCTTIDIIDLDIVDSIIPFAHPGILSVSLVVHEEGAVGVLEHGVGGEDGVVGLDDGAAELRRGPDDEVELALLAVVGAEALEEEAGDAGASATTDAVEEEDAETLSEKLQEQFEEAEFIVARGGQPLYYYYLSVE